MKIYTRTGDTGETALFGGGRVSKDHPRTSAYGEVDELNSAIGVARATAPAELFDQLLDGVQRDLFAIGGRLATPEPEKVAKAIAKTVLPPERVESFERVMDDAEGELPPLRAFVRAGAAAELAASSVAPEVTLTDSCTAPISSCRSSVNLSETRTSML